MLGGITTRIYRIARPGTFMAAATIVLPDDDATKQIVATLAEKLQRRTPQMLATNQSVPAVPGLVIGLYHEVDAWLEAKGLPAKPDEVSGKGTAQAWTLNGPQGSALAIVSAQDTASLESLIRPLPHYGRQSYIVFDGRQAVERGVWPVKLQRVEMP